MCIRCRHEDCTNYFGDFLCEITCPKCGELADVNKKVLSTKDIREEATIFMLQRIAENPQRRRSIVEGVKQFINRLEMRARSNENETPVRKKRK